MRLCVGISKLQELYNAYYMDYNDNGQMDDGEHVYDTYEDGGGGLDYDGDGWNDYNYEP